MRLPESAHAVSDARAFIKQWAAAQSITQAVADHAELVVDELVTNAVLHAQPPYDLQIMRSDQVIRGEVADRSPSPPAPRDPDLSGGFGLHIVDAEVSRWGVLSRGVGKTVWFEIDLTDQIDLTDP